MDNKIQELAKAANKSRKRSILGKIKHRLIPQHAEIVAYLESPVDQKSKFAELLTKEEMDYANYIEKYFSESYEYLIKMKELHGSRFIDEYMPHYRKKFLEKAYDDGLWSAVKNFWASQKESKEISMIMDQDTGNILPKNKFFGNVMYRTGELDPSQNITRAITTYAKAFEKKRMLDEVVQEMDFYIDVVESKAITAHGTKMDERFRKIIYQYINNKKGRHTSFGGAIKQNGFIDTSLRVANTFTSLKYIAGNVYAAAGAVVGEQWATAQALGYTKYITAWKRRVWDTGVIRLATKEGKNILKESEAFIGRNFWTDLARVDIGFGETAWKAIYVAFAQSSVEANKIMLLGSLSKAELKAGKLSAERLADIKLAAARYRDMGADLKSIYGSTSSGEAKNKFKGWALPILGTTYRNGKRLAQAAKKGKFAKQEAKELFTFAASTAAVITVGSWLVSTADDDTFVGKMKARIYRESLTLLGAISPSVFAGMPPLADDVLRLAKNIELLWKLEKYEQSGRGYRVGELKGVNALQKQFTPSAIKQFQEPTTVAEEIYKQLESADTASEKLEIIKEYRDTGELTDSVFSKIGKLKAAELAEPIDKEMSKAKNAAEKLEILKRYRESGELTDDVFEIIALNDADRTYNVTDKEKKLRESSLLNRAEYVKNKLDKSKNAAEKLEVLKELVNK
jgi:hypothetical protein